MNVLNALGVPLGDDMMPPTEDNAKGYFESLTIRAIHDDLLKSFGMGWATISVLQQLPPNWWQLPQVAPFRERLASLVREEFEKAGPIWGFKDPRTARLLPLWKDIVEQLDLDAKYVLVTRHPRDCAQSLYARERIPPVHAAELWLEHNVDALANLPGSIDAIVDYNGWFDEPVAQAELLIERLGLQWNGTRDELAAMLAGIVSSDLRHHDVKQQNFDLPFCAEFYDALRRRDEARLGFLTNIFQAANLYARLIHAEAARVLVNKVNEVTQIANERGQQVAMLQAQLAPKLPHSPRTELSGNGHSKPAGAVTLEVRVPISPTPSFFRQVEYLSRSFDLNAPGIDVRFEIFVGDDCEPYDLEAANSWGRGRVRWHWADRQEYRQRRYTATATERFRRETDADIVMFADADILVVGKIDSLLRSLQSAPAVAGVMAHVPPFIGGGPIVAGSSWQAVFTSAGRFLPRDRFQHTGWGTMFDNPEHRFGPAYFNFGVVFVPGRIVSELSAEYERQMPIAIRTPIHPVYHAQLAWTFAMYELDVPRVCLEPRYNYPNLEWADRTMPADLQDLRIVHYMGENVIGTRRGLWEDDKLFEAFVARRDLTGSNETLRRTVAQLEVSA